MKLCECGICGLEVKEGKRFIFGHHGKGKKLSQESIRKRTLTQKGRKCSLETKLKMSKSHKGQIMSTEARLKISLANIGNKNPRFGKKLSDEQRKKLKGRIPWNKGKSFSPESRLKMSQSRKGKKDLPETKIRKSISGIKYVEKTKLNGHRLYPREGNNEEYIFNIITENTGLIFLRNDYDMFLITGKFIDGIPTTKYNIDFEVIEAGGQHKFKSNGELSDYDQERELIIAYKLGCMIYYIPEQEFLKNIEKEIQRLKDFLLLLDERRN